MRPDLPKRFYKEAGVVERPEGFAIALDGRTARTPAKAQLAVPQRSLAEAMAAEWAAQDAVIDPSTMPLTRLVNVALDAVAHSRDEVAADIVAYSKSDLLCYRAEGPADLVRRQAEAWDPVLDWAAGRFGARLEVAHGIAHVSQPEAVAQAISDMLEGEEPLRLAALSLITTLTGSALLALAVAAGRLEPEAAWAAAHVDEDYQIERWGEDEEAMARRAARWRDMEAASRLLGLTR